MNICLFKNTESNKRIDLVRIFLKFSIFSCLVCCFAIRAEYFYTDIIDHKDGLPVAKINAMVQDKQGILWIASISGLIRYDGSRFKVYTHNPADKSTLTNNWVTHLFLDKDDRLYVATFGGGVNRFDKSTQSFEKVDSHSSITSSSVVKDNDDFLWYSSYPDLKKTSEKTGQHWTYPLEGHVKFLTPVEEDVYFFGTPREKKGLYGVINKQVKLIKKMQIYFILADKKTVDYYG